MKRFGFIVMVSMMASMLFETDAVYIPKRVNSGITVPSPRGKRFVDDCDWSSCTWKEFCSPTSHQCESCVEICRDDSNKECALYCEEYMEMMKVFIEMMRKTTRTSP